MENSFPHAQPNSSSEPGSPFQLIGFAEGLPSKSEEASRRLHAMLSQWLRMENVVVLLGAGASKGAGGPLVSELESDVLHAVRDTCAATAGLESCAELLTARLSASASADAMGFEGWLSTVAMLGRVRSAIGTPIGSVTLQTRATEADPVQEKEIDVSSMGRLMHLIEGAILLRCSITLEGIDEGSLGGHHAFFAKLAARDPALGRVHVFTTNYDTLIEQALDELGVRYSDGFVGTVTRRFDGAGYGLDLYYPGEVTEGRVRRFDKFMHLYKIHGSVTWRRRANGRVELVGGGLTLSWKEWLALAPSSRESALDEVYPASAPPLAVLPTEYKTVETLGLPYSLLLRAFHQHLNAPQTFLLVSGYGFADEHINLVVDQAMTNPSLVLLVVDPNPSADLLARVKRYQASGERAFLLTKADGAPEPGPTFDVLGLDLLPNVQWIDDLIRLRRVEREIAGLGPEAQAPQASDV